ARRQVAEILQELQQALPIRVRQLFVECALVDALAQQFRHVTARIVVQLPVFDGAAAKGLIVMVSGSAVGGDLYLERNRKASTIIQHAKMLRGNAGRTRVEVEPLVPVAGLRCAVQLAYGVTATHREVATTRSRRRLEDGDRVSGSLQLEGRCQPGDTGSEYDDATAIARAGRDDGSGCGAAVRRQQSQRLHGHECGAEAHRADSLDELP